jgi:hypothetical protein
MPKRLALAIAFNLAVPAFTPYIILCNNVTKNSYVLMMTTLILSHVLTFMFILKARTCKVYLPHHQLMVPHLSTLTHRQHLLMFWGYALIHFGNHHNCRQNICTPVKQQHGYINVFKNTKHIQLKPLKVMYLSNFINLEIIYEILEIISSSDK